jgi:hypothetical protein
MAEALIFVPYERGKLHILIAFSAGAKFYPGSLLIEYQFGQGISEFVFHF